MIARWDALLLAAILSGGSMLIENSHRVDTGATDDALASLPAGACAGTSAERTDLNAGSDLMADGRFSLSAADDATPAGCE